MLHVDGEIITQPDTEMEGKIAHIFSLYFSDIKYYSVSFADEPIQSTHPYGGSTVAEQLKFFFMKIFRQHGVCSVPFLKQHLLALQADGGMLRLHAIVRHVSYLTP